MSPEPKSEFLRVLTERGFIHQQTDVEGLDKAFLAGSVSAYIGFDCTAPSLHVGSLVQIMMLRWLQKCGHRPIVLMGGGTTRVGDPSGKDESRKLLSDDDINRNMASIRQVFSKYVQFPETGGNAVMVNNADWLDTLQYIAFLRDYGRHFSINRMLTFDSVKLRLEREQPLSFLEFNYMILQAYDFVELARRNDCVLQMGGADQWGNIVNGVELGRRVLQKELFGLTTALITTASGAKMGKTADGAVWLNADMRSPYEYWQFWRNTEDGDVGRFLRLFTDLPMDEVRRLEALQGKEINDAKKVLANATTTLLHGAEAAAAAQQQAESFFAGGAAAGGETVELPKAKLDEGLSLIEALRLAGLAESNSAAKKLIQQGGARINDEQIKDEKAKLSADQLRDGAIKVSAGKKHHKLLRFV